MDGVIRSEEAAVPIGHYPHARRVGRFLFLSGIGPRRPGISEIPGVSLDARGFVAKYDIVAQTRAVFENIEAVLAAAGLALADIVDVTVFLTDMTHDYPSFNRMWTEHFPENPPCRTTVEVRSLPTPIAIELKCIAAFPEQ